jgi:hypothetical protein
MLPKEKNINQMGFYSTFEEQLNHNHPLYKLSLAIRWHLFDEAFSAKTAFVDRGYRGPKTVNETTICVPKPDKHITKTKRKRHSRRAAIEPVIGHLKSNYGMKKTF